MKDRNLSFFVADVHLGLKSTDGSAVEAKFLRFLHSLPENTKSLYLLGDIFDFWYEYKYTIPRGHTRVLGALASLVDSGVELYYISGNHDIWTYDYFQKEIGARFLPQPSVIIIGKTSFCIGHGDGLGETPTGYKILRAMFHNKFIQSLFSCIHPRWAFGLGYSWSHHTRLAKLNKSNQYSFRGSEEPIFKYANEFGRNKKIDYYIFGHFHSPFIGDIPTGGKLYMLGEWVHNCDYLVFDSQSGELSHKTII